MFVGSRIQVGQVAGTNVEMVQKTEYPWKGSVAITVNPEETRKFSVYVRIPDRSTSKLYRTSPAVRGVKRFSVNGEEQVPRIDQGYAVITRTWKRGDRIELELPLEPQRVQADPRVTADRELVSLQYGPLVYNVEKADNREIDRKIGDGPLRADWRPDLLGGIVVITGNWEDGSPLLAVPNFVRMNRVGPPPDYPGEAELPPGAKEKLESKVWI